MRSLTSAAIAEIAERTGTEPINIIQVSWTDGNTQSYADRSIAGIPGKVISISNLDEVIKLENRGSTASVSVVLDDSDSSIQALLGEFDVHRRPVTIFQYFAGMSLSDAFVLMVGWVSSPIVWNEGERTFSFDVLSKYLSQEVGFTPEQGQLPYVPADLVGKTWPLAFGSVVNVPATKYAETVVGFTGVEFGYPDPTLDLKISILQQRLARYAVTYSYYQTVMQIASQISRAPDLIKEDYINLILEEDELKQQREDYATQLTDLDRNLQQLKELVAEAETAQDQQDVLSTLQAQQGYRQQLVENLLPITQRLTDIAVEKQVLAIEADNREYAYKVIGEVRTKLFALISTYYTAVETLHSMQDALFLQQKLIRGTIDVGNGYLFPQGGTISVIVEGLIFRGTMTGRTFSIASHGARYTDVKLGPRQDSQDSTQLSRPDAFWIADPTINLKGLYLLLGNGYITKVTEQQGTECIIELVERQQPSGKEAGDKPQAPPADSDLNMFTWSQLAGAQEHTDGEREKIIEQAQGKDDQGDQIKEMRKNIQSLIDLLPEASTEADAKDVQDAIFNNMGYFNDVVSNLTLPPDIQAKADEKISQEEFALLLKLQNLKKTELAQAESAVEPILPFLKSKYFVTGLDVQSSGILEASPYVLPSWLSRVSTEQFYHLPATSPLIVRAGTPVTLADNYQNKYIANILPSTLVAVSAFRSIQGFRVLVPVPSSFYQWNGNLALGVVQDGIFYGLHVSQLQLIRPLSELAGEGWEDQPYVTLISSVGPNTADVIQFLLQTYSNVTCDSGSFAAVRGYLANYPSHFVLAKQSEVIQLCEDIAWQARCRIDIKGNVARLTYLPREPAAVATITEDSVLEGSLSVETTETENLVTEFRAKYTPDLAYPDRVYTVVLRHNFTRYGRIEKDYDFFIYNIESLIQKSATFWMIRLSNTFKRVKFKCPLTMLNVETGDTVLLSFSQAWVASGSVKAIVEKAIYNSEDNSIDVECWVPVVLGSETIYPFAWPQGISAQLLFPAILDINGGNAGNPIGQYVPTGQAFTIDQNSALSDNTVQLRPKDYGDIKPSDSGDAIPPDPTSGFGEVDYTTGQLPDAISLPADVPLSTDLPTYVNWGGRRVRSDQILPKTVTGTTVLSTSADAPGSGGMLVTVIDPIFDPSLGPNEVSPIYNVILMDGTRRTARQRQINTRSKIPNGTQALMIYDQHANEYQIQVPVWGSN